MDRPDRLPPPVPEKAALMRRFDALPADVRRAMSSAAFQFHPLTPETQLKRGRSAAQVTERLKATDHGCYVRMEGEL